MTLRRASVCRLVAAVVLASGLGGARGAVDAAPERPPPSDEARPAVTPLPVRDFALVRRESGDVNYYEVIDDPSGPFIRAVYRPPIETAVLGIEIPARIRRDAQRVRWRWRAMTLPGNGHDCRGPRDSAAAVYLTFNSGLRWYSLKYVWSAVGPAGVACVQTRTAFGGQAAIVLRGGGPTGVWRTEVVDPYADFRRFFRKGDPHAEVPDLVGIGIMSDGDQTGTISAADYGDFAVVSR